MRAIAVIVVALLIAGCDRGASSAPAPAKGKANLRVTVIAKPKTGAKPFQTYQPSEAAKAEAAASKGELELVDYDHLSDIVVWVEPVNATTAVAGAEHKISLTSKSAKPPLFAGCVGDWVTFKNDAAKPLRIYSVSEGNEFDLPRLPPGEMKAQPLLGTGLVEVLDGETLEVIARVYVAPGRNARLVLSGEATTFRDLDPGAYRVAAWHERVPGNERDVTLSPDTVRELDLLIGVNALPKVE